MAEVLRLGVGLNTDPAKVALKKLKTDIDTTFAGNGTTKLDVQIQKTTVKLEDERRKAAALREQLNKIATSEVTPKSIETLSAKVQKSEKEVAKLSTRFDELASKKNELLSTGFEIKGKTIFTPETESNIKKVDEELSQVKNQLRNANAETATLQKQLRNMQLDPALTPEFQKANEQLLKTEGAIRIAESELKRLQTTSANAGEEMQRLQSTGVKTGNALSASIGNTVNSLGKFERRIVGLAKRVFVFSMITKAFRSLRTIFGNLIKQDKELSTSLQQIKNNLLLAFAPIYEKIIPWLRALMHTLAQVTSVLAHFISAIMGVPMSKAASTARGLSSALKSAETATDKTSKTTQKATDNLADMTTEMENLEDASEETQKSLLGFDELNILNSPEQEIDIIDADAISDATDAIDDFNDAVEEMESIPQFNIVDTLYESIKKTFEKFEILIAGAILTIGVILLLLGNIGLGAALVIAGVAMLYEAVKEEWEKCPEEVGKALMTLAAVIGESMLVIGTVLLLMGHFGIGIALIIAGLTIEAVIVDWDILPKEMETALQAILTIIGTAMLAIGTILLLTGNIPEGIALIIAGLTIEAVIVDWDSLPEQLKTVLDAILAIIGTFMLAIGTVLLLTGNIPAGIALIIAGLTVEAVVVDWDALPEQLKTVLETILAIIGTFMLAIGTILLLTGNIPAGIALIIAGLTVEVAIIDWDSLPEQLKTVIQTILEIIATAMLAIGAILLFAGNIPAGIALIIAGITIGLTEVDWEALPEQLKETIASISAIVGMAFFEIGAILLFLGQIGMGAALIIAGAVGMVTAIMVAPNELRQKIQEEISFYLKLLGGSLVVIGAILCFTGAGIGVGLALMAAGGVSLLGGAALGSQSATSLMDTMDKSLSGLNKSVNKKFGAMEDTVADSMDNINDTVADGVDTAAKTFDKLSGRNATLTATVQQNVIQTVSTSNAGAAIASVPHLASGTVIPPNREFMAVLGDQKSGTNVEAPLSTIKQAVADVIGSGGFGGNPNVRITFGGSLAQLGRVLKPQIQYETVRTGDSLMRSPDMTDGDLARTNADIATSSENAYSRSKGYTDSYVSGMNESIAGFRSDLISLSNRVAALERG